ncbi:YfhO family protein [Fulvivirga sp. 29W222]|uniref:YfhO family protein n=1 Tax=Fulvivirga marina TaxID=2494733 RepID=A0A937FVY3_9BACT|nr:YfhO family protein [Fulvivirga marina]MBL6445296.1 YfhO family protein [Fulvivirga marina]
MKNINFSKQVLPHIVAILSFLVITILFFNPIFFGNKNLDQHDILQWKGGAQESIEFREKTGEEALWTNSMFGGMPAYLVNVEWNDGIISGIKKALSLFLPHPIKNIFLAFLSCYILLLVFRVRPYLAIAGAIAFGLSSFMIIGLGAGHNARIGAIAYMPLVLAGIHLTFTKNRILGFGLTATALALELRENHLQITYYLLLMVIIYGIVMFADAIKKGEAVGFIKNSALLIVAAIIALGTFFGKFWTTYEYSQYSMRGKSELTTTSNTNEGASGLKKDYAFQYSNGILEPITLMIPNFYGGASSNYLVQDEDSEVLKALQRTGDSKAANQLARYTSAYWGNQPLTAPYYAGAVICFLFIVGIIFADKKYTLWLVIAALLGIMLSWGDSFKAFNYFMFDYFPGYNKFRSVTFALIITLLAFPLLGFIGLEKLIEKGLTKETQKKLFIALGTSAGVCLLVALFAGMASFTKDGETQLPGWFLNALQEDRKGLMRGDALRSLLFILIAFALVFMHLKKKITFPVMAGILSLVTLIDHWAIDKRYFGEDNYKRVRDNSFFAMTEADKEIKKDKDPSYRVYNLTSYTEARTSYYHQSLGGYHGAKLRRYQDLYDHCLGPETSELIQNLQAGNIDLSGYGIINMLNARYLTFGPSKTSIIRNNEALGNAWFVSSVETAKNPDEELQKICTIDTRHTAVVDASKFSLPKNITYDSSSSIKLTQYEPNHLIYESNSSTDGLAVFSEIYYPIGWTATINGQPANILRANFVLRALEVPKGKHKIEFIFAPKSYSIGNTATMISSIILLLLALGSIGWSLKNHKKD